MTYRLTKILRLSVFLLAAALTGPASAQDSASTLQAANKLTKWFGELLSSFRDIGETADRKKLIDALADLNAKLYDLELDKRSLVVVLERRPLVRSELQQATYSLPPKIGALQDSLRRVGPKLRLAYRKGGDESLNLLSEALMARKAFLQDLENMTQAGAASEVLEAKAAVEALKVSQAKLADVIDALKKQ